MYIMLLDLYIIFCFVSLVIKSFKKVFMRYFTISCIIVYSTTIIPDTLDKVASCIELRVVKCWSI